MEALDSQSNTGRTSNLRVFAVPPYGSNTNIVANRCLLEHVCQIRRPKLQKGLPRG
jgi:hypothetical protein